jgi:O-antigen/teichoic acid export membrane protein
MVKQHTLSLAANYATLSAAELLSKVLTAIAFVYLARVLGPQNYGFLEFSLALLVILTLAVDSGLNSYGAREIAKDATLGPDLIVHVALIRAVLAVTAIIAVWLLSAVLNQPEPVKNLLRWYSLTLILLPGMVQWVFQGLDRMRVVALASVVRWLAFSLGIFLFVRGANDLWLAPLVEFAAMSGAVLLLVRLMLRVYHLRGARVDWHKAFAIYRKALPIGASEIVWAGKMYFATVWLGLMVGAVEVGWFSAAHRIVISLHAFVWLYFYNLLPSIARSSKQPAERLQELMGFSLQATAWVAVFLGVFGSAFAGAAIALLYPAQYGQTAAAFQVLIWLIPLAWMSGHYRYTLIGYDQQRLEFVSAVVGLVVNIALNLALIPAFGLVGAAWALVASEAAIWVTAYAFLRRSVTHIPVLSRLALPLVAGGLLLVALYLLIPINVWLAGISATLLYGLFLLVAQPHLFGRLRSMSMLSSTPERVE